MLNTSLYCLHDRGQIESIGRFVLDNGVSVEVGICHFDGVVSGFRWDDDEGWTPVFLREYSLAQDTCTFRIVGDGEGESYSVEEIDFELACLFEERRILGL